MESTVRQYRQTAPRECHAGIDKVLIEHAYRIGRDDGASSGVRETEAVVECLRLRCGESEGESLCSGDFQVRDQAVQHPNTTACNSKPTQLRSSDNAAT